MKIVRKIGKIKAVRLGTILLFLSAVLNTVSVIIQGGLENETIEPFIECPKLDKVAFCADGYTDVIESKDKKFYIGVRFHSESLYKTDKNMNNIFEYFIRMCKK